MLTPDAGRARFSGREHINNTHQLATEIQQAASLTKIASTSGPTNNLSHDDRLGRAVQLADYLKTARPAALR